MTVKDYNTASDSKFFSANSYRLRFALSFFFLVLILLSQYFHNSSLATFTLMAVAVLSCGWHIFNSAFEDLKNLRLSFNIFASVSILSGLFFSLLHLVSTVKTIGGIQNFFVLTVFNVAIINFVYASFSKRREISKAFVKKMEDFLPKSARLVINETEKKVFASELNPGDIILIKQGEVIPTDGKIMKGKTEIEESLITGNMVAVMKAEGSNVFAGTVNKTNDIYVEVLSKASASELHSVVRNVKKSEMRKILTKNPLDDYAKYFFLPVFTAVIIYCFYSLHKAGLGWENAEKYLSHFLFLSTLAMPAAFSVTIGLTNYFAIKGAEHNGITVQNPLMLKNYKEADAVFLDKTGTITQGVFTVTGVFPVNKDGKNNLLRLILSAEQSLSDPYAAAIINFCKSKRITADAATSIDVIAGRGVKAVVGNETIMVGNKFWLEEESVKIKEFGNLNENEVIIYASSNKEFIGAVALADPMRPMALETVGALKAAGKEIVILSGDNKKTVSHIAQSLNLEQARYAILPEEKAAMVRGFKHEGKKVAMIGDGFNDVLAMLDADVSIVFMTKNSAHANWVDIVINRPDLWALNILFKIYNTIKRNTYQNMVIAFLVNIMLLAFLFGRTASPWYTVSGFTALALVLITINSIRLVRRKYE
ncbi:Cu+-exporting ATPase [Elusimicrobium posterum]|uniref:heavy metal translocating P-type ATPase n=1 Tax=Elusimicrobium posterum TaxID=3116653 RepID=UPI003C74C352